MTASKPAKFNGIDGPLHALTFWTGDGDLETAIDTMSCVCGWKHEFPVGFRKGTPDEIESAIIAVISEHRREIHDIHEHAEG